MTFDDVLLRFATIIAEQREAGSPLAYFPCLYRAVTRRVRAGVAAGQFDDGPRMERFVTGFATLYFDAYDAFRAGGSPPSPWTCAFTAATRGELLAVQHLLLGMNAHINRDLAVAAVEAAGPAGLDALGRDFDHINDVLAALAPEVKAAIERFSPLIGELDHVAGAAEDDVLGFSIERARADAWLHARILAGQPDVLHPLTMRLIEQKAAFLARLVADPPGLAGQAATLVREAESTDVRAIADALASLA